jgi:hypothetical protein
MADASIPQVPARRDSDTLVLLRSQLRRVVARVDRLAFELERARERAAQAETDVMRLRSRLQERDNGYRSMVRHEMWLPGTSSDAGGAHNGHHRQPSQATRVFEQHVTSQAFDGSS